MLGVKEMGPRAMNMMKSTPKHQYQQDIRDFAAGKSKIGLFAYYGSGKTYLTMQWIADMIERGNQMLPALVLCPKNLVFQWGSQIEEHSHFTHSIIDGSPSERREAIKKKADFYIVNYAAIRSQIKADLNLLSARCSTVVADESIFLKSAKTLRFKLSYRLFGHMSHKAILSGKPITEKAQDIWSQMLFLDEGRRLGTSYWHFIKDNFDEDPFVMFGKKPKPGGPERLANKINDICIYVPREKVAEQLPPRTIIPVYFEMPASARKQYNELRKNFRLEFESGAEIDTQWAFVKSAKLHQICQGFVYTHNAGENRATEIIETLKFDWLKDSLADIWAEGPVLIWAYHRKTIFDICEILSEMSIPFDRFMGGDDQSGVDRFRAGQKDILVLSTSAAAAGLNLQRARSAIFVSQGYSGDMRDNSLARNYRLGSEVHDQVLVYDLLTKNSIDEVVYKALADKADIADAILKHLVQS